jgi:hypothetical protein
MGNFIFFAQGFNVPFPQKLPGLGYNNCVLFAPGGQLNEVKLVVQTTAVYDQHIPAGRSRIIPPENTLSPQGIDFHLRTVTGRSEKLQMKPIPERIGPGFDFLMTGEIFPDPVGSLHRDA